MTVKFVRFLTAVLVLLMVVGLAGAAQASEPVPGAEITVEQGPPVIVQLWIGQNQAMVNGESKTLDTAPILYQDRTMVPLRFIAESLGAKVQWDPAEQKIEIAAEPCNPGDLVCGGVPGAEMPCPPSGCCLNVVLWIGQNRAFVNGEPKALNVPPTLYEDRTMVPLRFIAEAMGADVKWDPAEQCITIALATVVQPPPVDSVNKMEQANKTFRAEIKTAMQEAAQQAKIELAAAEPVDVIAKQPQSTNPDIKVVNYAVQGVDTLTIEQLAKGADVIFTFIQLPKGSELPSGFYVIRISGDPKANKWVAQFKNMDGKVVLEKPAEVGPGDSHLDKGVLKVSIEISFPGPTVGFDIHFDFITITVKSALKIGDGGSNPTPLPEAGQKVVQAAEEYDVSVNDALTQAAKKYEEGISDGWMSLSEGDDLFAAHTVFEGVNDLTSEELAKGQDVFFGYFRTPKGSKLPAGFYNVRIVQESGRWLGRFVNDKGKVIYEAPAEVAEGGNTVKEAPGFWHGHPTGGVGEVDWEWTDRNGTVHSIKITIS
jgi:hypothetical protein